MLATSKSKPRIDRREALEKRFDAVCEIGNFHGRKVLDAGCGGGELLDLLLRWEIVPDYTGLDRDAAAISRCRRRFEDWQGPSCRWVTADVLRYSPPHKFDFVVADGNLLPDPAPALKRLFSWCEVALAASFPAAALARVLPLALEMTPAVRFSKDYLPDEFMIYLYRRPSWQEGR